MKPNSLCALALGLAPPLALVGRHSIRINDQWRICFVWRADGAYEVEIVDYH